MDLSPLLWNGWSNMAPKFKGFFAMFSKKGRLWNGPGFSISYETWVLPFHRASIKEDVVVAVGVVVVGVAVVVA